MGSIHKYHIIIPARAQEKHLRLRCKSHIEFKALKFPVDHINPERKCPPDDPYTTIQGILFSSNVNYIL